MRFIDALVAEFTVDELFRLADDADVIRNSATYAVTWERLADALGEAHRVACRREGERRLSTTSTETE